MPTQPDPQPTWWSERSVEAGELPVVIGERWVLGALLGRGGFGRVVAAEDRHTGDAVAVKLIERVSAGMRRRLSRELAALRRLSHPGVVRFLADLPVGDGHCIVMEQLPSTVFPGKASADWASLREVVLALFRALAHIHDHDIIHRDLKPSNVLMRDQQPVLLDFGLARGPELGTTITRSGARVGTLRYMSPEQGAGERVTLRTDLYSAGVMVYQALTGHMPHRGRTGEAQLRARLARPATPIRDHRPDLPIEVATTIDALLRRDPSERPSDAHAVLQMLDGMGTPELPWLGDPAVLARTLEHLDCGATLAVAGPEGSGRSRLLQEVAARRPHHWLRPGTRPYESLGALIAGIDLSSAASGAEAREWVQAALRQRLPPGAVLLVDDVALDWSTQQLLDRHDGPVLQVARAARRDSGVTISLSFLSESSLRSLFQGPDRVLHLREDAAAELHRRTDGHPARVVRELSAWQRAGLVSLTQDGLLVERSTLDRLRAEQPPRARAASHEPSAEILPAHLETVLCVLQMAGRHASPQVLGALTDLSGWQLDETVEELCARGFVRLEAGRMVLEDAVSTAGWTPEERAELHARLVTVLPEGAEDRLHHMLEGGVQDGLVRETLASCRTLERAGLVAEARAWLERAARSTVDDAALRPVVEAHVRLALDAADASVARQTVELVRQCPQAAGEGLRRLADAIEALEADDAERAREILVVLPPFEDRQLEAQRIRHVQMKAERLAAGSDVTILQAAMAEEWPTPWPAVWSALWAYRQRDLRAAAEALEAAAEAEQRTAHRVRDRLQAASLWSMVGELERTTALAVAGMAEARQKRLAALELRAEWTLRMVAQKTGATDVDWDLVRAAEQMGPTTDDAGFVALTESYVAFQGGDYAAMTRLARQALHPLTQRGLADGVQMATGLVAAGESRWDALRTLCKQGSLVARGDLLSLLVHFGVATPEDQQQLLDVGQSLSRAGLGQVGLFNLSRLQ